MSNKEKILNIAVIAHVDAGKSTLVDAFLRQSDVFRDNEEVVDCIMDSNDLERERGITIIQRTALSFTMESRSILLIHQAMPTFQVKLNVSFVQWIQLYYWLMQVKDQCRKHVLFFQKLWKLD